MQKIKDQVRLYLGEESADLRLYAGAYKSDIMRPWREASLKDLETCLQQVNLVFGGDFHPFAQAQRAHLRVMRQMADERPLVLALECLKYEHQDWVSRFLREEIGEDAFLKAIGWEKNWGFPWSHYRPLFEFAKRKGIPVFGLSRLGVSDGEDLHARDQVAADILVRIYQEYSEALIYTVFGDLHVAQRHLPRVFQDQLKGLGGQVETATLYLNSEHIYFELAEKGREALVDIVSFNDRQFCLLSSPPWVKWQSYLMYLEENFDISLEVDDEDDDWDFRLDHTDHVSSLVQMISVALGVEVKTDAIEVYSLQDPQAFRQVQKGLAAPEARLAFAMIRADRSFYAPRAGFFYLSKSTVNHAAGLAGYYVHAHFCDRNQLYWNFPKDFLVSIWLEAMSFLLSKLVNPKRKAQSMADLKKQLQAFDKKDKGREPLLLALDQKMAELLVVYGKKDRAQVYRPSEKSSYLMAAQFLGPMLGERYFVLFQKRRIDLPEIKQLLQQSVADKNFQSFYYDQLRALDRLEMEGEALR